MAIEFGDEPHRELLDDSMAAVVEFGDRREFIAIWRGNWRHGIICFRTMTSASELASFDSRIG
jgi:hypothetical protein